MECYTHRSTTATPMGTIFLYLWSFKKSTFANGRCKIIPSVCLLRRRWARCRWWLLLICDFHIARTERSSKKIGTSKSQIAAHKRNGPLQSEGMDMDMAKKRRPHAPNTTYLPEVNTFLRKLASDAKAIHNVQPQKSPNTLVSLNRVLLLFIISNWFEDKAKISYFASFFRSQGKFANEKENMQSILSVAHYDPVTLERNKCHSRVEWPEIWKIREKKRSAIFALFRGSLHGFWELTSLSPKFNSDIEIGRRLATRCQKHFSLAFFFSSNFQILCDEQKHNWSIEDSRGFISEIFVYCALWWNTNEKMAGKEKFSGPTN